MLVFLKLGGSLITDKTRPYTSRPEIMNDLAAQIASAMHEDANLLLVLGHGSGSFGHTAASQFDTRRGVSKPEAWRGFAEVWYQASLLNRLVVEALHRARLPILTFSPASAVIAHNGEFASWDLVPLQAALEHGLLPIVHGDVVFDSQRGGTILSTEDLFVHLAKALHPQRILLAGMEEGVWENFPARTRLVEEIIPGDLAKQVPGLGQSASADVTGGMESKVRQMADLVVNVPDLEVLIFSGNEPGNIRRALLGASAGTRLHR